MLSTLELGVSYVRRKPGGGLAPAVSGILIQDLAHHSRQSLGAEGLLQEVHTSLQPAGVDDGIACVSRHVENRQPGHESQKTSSEFVSLRAPGEDEIREKEVEAIVGLLRNALGLFSGPGAQDSVTETATDASNQMPHGGLIVHG